MYPLREIFKVSFRRQLFIVLVLALVFRVLTFGSLQLGGYDERVYGMFARTAGEKGIIEGVRFLARQFPNDAILMKGPAPLRILYIFVGMLACKLLGGYSLANLAVVSFISGIGIIIFGFLIFRQWFRFHIAILASLLLIVSPLATALSTRALQDAFFAFIVIAIVFFYHRCWQQQKNTDLFILGVFLLAGFLTKETLFFLYPSFILAAIYYRKEFPRASLIRIAIPFLIAPLFYFLIIIWVAGGLDTFLRTYFIFTKVGAHNDYPAKFQPGPWFRYIIDFMLLSPLTYLFSVAGIVSVIRNKRDQNGQKLCLIYMLSGLIIFSSLSMVMPLFNLRWVLFLDVPLRALSALGIIFVAGKVQNPVYRPIVAVCLVMLVLGIDIHQFFRVFVKSGAYDPVTAALITANGFIK